MRALTHLLGLTLLPVTLTISASYVNGNKGATSSKHAFLTTSSASSLFAAGVTFKRAPSACAVTVPNGSTPPGEQPGPLYHGANGIWTGLWAEGRVVFAPGGPGSIEPDGSLAMKFWWWRAVRGRLTIEGRRLDAPARPLGASIPEGYGDIGFQASGLIFPTEGCWEVTGRVGEASLTFVTQVVKANAATSVSAASFSDAALAAESISAAFGISLATATETANTFPLPTTLAGTSVKIKDSTGTERLAPLFSVSPMQVNYQIPPGTANGRASMTFISGNEQLSVGTAQIVRVAPGIFAANANGQGVAAAIALRIRADNSRTTEPIARFDVAQNKFVSIPLDLGPEGDQLFLVLFGTGFRYNSGLSSVTSKIGGTNAQVTFAGAQGNLVGFDQANLRVPRSLIGRGEMGVVLTVDSQISNTVRVNIN